MLKKRKHLALLLKLLILAATCWFIYHKVSEPGSVEKIQAFFDQPISTRTIGLLSAVCLLMVANWGAEVFKWKFLIRKVEPISTWKSTESLLAGLTLAIFTPNRIGEYGGRILYLHRGNRVKGMFAMGVGALSLMLITYTVGAIAFFAFADRFLGIDDTVVWAIGIAAVMVGLLFLIFYFNVRWLYIVLASVPFLARFKRFFKVLLLYNRRELLVNLSYSLLRYLFFTTQHFLLIHLFIPSLDYFTAFMIICIVLMVQSIIPTMALLDDLGVRGATSTYFFGFAVQPSDASFVVAAAFGVWLVNIILPAIAGLIFVFKANFFGNND